MAIEEDPPAGIPEWVVTFGDMMSLLLTFFIMLVSMSEMKADKKFQAMAESLKRQFGHDRSVASTAPGKLRPRNAQLDKLSSMGRSKRTDTMRGGAKVKATVGENTLTHSAREAQQVGPVNLLFFEEGAAKLTDEHKQALRVVVEQCSGKPLKIEVRGHTTARPAPGFKDDWDLAYARCHATMDYLVSKGIDRRRFVLVPVGANEPLVRDNPELMWRNSRVEIVMLDEMWQEKDGTRAERENRPVDPQQKEKLAPNAGT